MTGQRPAAIDSEPAGRVAPSTGGPVQMDPDRRTDDDDCNPPLTGVGQSLAPSHSEPVARPDHKP